MSVPPPDPPRPSSGKRVFALLCGVGGAAVGVGVVVALGVWGGAIGRVLVAAGGFAAAGVLLPWVVVAIAVGNKDPGCVHGVVSGLGGVAGLALGIWFGLTTEDLPWWVHAGGGTLAALIGGVVGWLVGGRVLGLTKR